MINTYIFDLDGTIIDSGEDIANSVNVAFEHFGYFRLSTEKLVSFVGDGARKLLERALLETTRKKFDFESDFGKKQFDEILSWYLEYYFSHSVEKTRLYAGIKELLKVLSKKNKNVALLTNKPAQISYEILKHFEIDKYFSLIVSPDCWVDVSKGEVHQDKNERKPNPKALEITVQKLCEIKNVKIQKENVLMIGDSKVDIQCGKAFGCKTVGCRGGLGKTDEMLAENPDFSFSVASEIEKFIDVLAEKDDVSEIQKFAMENEVPILQDAGSDFICEYIKNHDIKSILEIGTAIGFSSIRFAKIRENISVTTIEIDETRHNAAKENVKKENLDDRIELIFGDALEAQIDKKFDLIFIDAAKAQYIKFFEKYKENLNENGVIFSDNLSFHGMVEDLSLTHNYSTIKLVKKIRKYIDFLKNNEEFETEFFKIGDGVSVSKRIN